MSKLDQQFAAHDKAAAAALKAGATPREATIKGMVAELMFQGQFDAHQRKGK